MAVVGEDLAERLNAVATDPTLSPAARVSELRRVRSVIESRRDQLRAAMRDMLAETGELSALIGSADSYIGQNELEREAESMEETLVLARLRENADLRVDLLAQGFSEDALDDAGFWSHEDLDALDTDGEIQEAAFGLRSKFQAWAGSAQGKAALRAQAAKRRRDRTGQFADQPGAAPKLRYRGGGAKPTGAPQSPGAGVAPSGRGSTYEERKPGFDAEVSAKAAKGVAARGPASPGSKQTDTAPVADRNEPRWAGHASQKELLAYAADAASQPTTVSAYSVTENGERYYDETRREVHEKILSAMLDDIPAQPEGEARVFFTGGGYASGKGAVVDTHDDVPPDSLVIDPDTIKAMLPEFDALLEEDPEANLLVYEEAWDISQELQRRAIEKNVNVTVDGISDTSPDDMIGRVKLFTEAGYKNPKAVYVNIPTEEAIFRAGLRAKKAKKRSDRRFIPDLIMRSVHRDVSATLPGVIERAAEAGLSIEVWDNNQGWDKENDRPIPPVPVFRFTPETGEEIVDEKLWREALDKGKEKIPGIDGPPLTMQEAEVVDPDEQDPAQRSEFEPDLAPEDGVIDLPWESGSADPQPLKYRDLGPEKRYEEGADFRETQARALGLADEEGDDEAAAVEPPSSEGA